MKVLCPYCGHHQKEGDEQCESCHGLFEPLSRTASQIAMGPWYVRNDDKPFLPGFSLSLLRRLVAGGRITEDSVVRGPGTHQLWTRARFAHGVAHLLGLCHACGADVDPRVQMCAHCAAQLRVGGDRDTLGLPTVPTQQAVMDRVKLNGSLCPICANDALANGTCDACQRVFTPVDRATRVTLGPWQLRDSQLPFTTGMSWVQLKQKIEAGEVTGDWLVRGPTSHQFFSVVRHTPGLAHLAGKCYQCASSVKPTDTACANCAATLNVTAPPDALGLMFKTDAEAAEAQARLDAQIAAINDPDIQKPVPAATPKKQSHAPTPAPPAAAPTPTPAQPTAPTPAQEPAATQSPPVSVPPPAQASAPAPASDLEQPAFESTGPRPRSRHAAMAQKKTNPLVFVFTGLLTLIAFGSIFWVISQNANPREDGDAIVEPQPDTPDPVDFGNETPNPAQRRNFNEIVSRFERLEEAEQTPRLKPLLAEADKQLSVVRKLWDAGKITLATQQFPAVLAKLTPAENVVRARSNALVFKGDAVDLREKAEDEDAPEIAPRQFDAADKLVEQATSAFEKEDYEIAEKHWDDAVEQYKLSLAYVKAEEKSASLRRRFDKDLVKLFTAEQIEAGGGPLLAEARMAITLGETQYKDGEYPDAVETYTKAHELIPKIELAVKRAIGVHYWAINTGYRSADLLLKRASGQPVTDEDREAFSFAVDNLGLGPSLKDALPGGAEPDFAALSKVVAEDTAAQILDQRGSSAEVSFKLGLQFRIFQQMLETDGDLLSPQDESKIRTTLTLLYKEAQDAGYPQAFVDRLDAVKAMLNVKPKFEAIRQARVAWAKLYKELEEFEKAMSLIPMSSNAPAKDPKFFPAESQ